jgi:sodium transport system ATP-binding protein
MIEARGLCKSFGSNRAVDEVSFIARDGEITGLLGPNGAGKTTTLRMLYTLMRPDAGTILIDGRDALLEPLAVRRTLGVLPDSRGLYKRLTARENIEYFAALQGLSAAQARLRSDALIATLGMQDIAARPTSGFSQGERVKTAIARALVHDPRNLLLDEPTNGLDPQGTREVRTLIRDLARDGTTVLVSSHLLGEIEQVASHVGIMSAGRLLKQGPLNDVLSEMASHIRVSTTSAHDAARVLDQLGLLDLAPEDDLSVLGIDVDPPLRNVGVPEDLGLDLACEGDVIRLRLLLFLEMRRLLLGCGRLGGYGAARVPGLA